MQFFIGKNYCGLSSAFKLWKEEEDRRFFDYGFMISCKAKDISRIKMHFG